MAKVWWIAAALCLALSVAAQEECKPAAPCYSAGSVVNGASFVPGVLAPNALATIFGTRLAWATRAIAWEDIHAGELPTTLGLTGVRVLVNSVPAHLYYVSPTQVNFLVPTNASAAEATIQLVRDATAGPPVRVRLRETAPALFLMDAETVVASKEDFSVITREAPARPGEFAILWATGLGPTVPPMVYGRVPRTAAVIEQLTDFRVLLDGVPLEPWRIGYAGIAPGFAGLYQINVKLPETLPADPEIRIAAGDEMSPPGVRLLTVQGR